MPRTRTLVMISAGVATALAAVLWTAPLIRRINPTFVAHEDPHTAAVAGTVVDPDGRPLAGVPVAWSQAVGDRSALGTQLFASTKATAVSGPDGSFLLTGLESRDGFVGIGQKARHEGQTRELTPRVGARATGLVLTATPIEAGRYLRGRLIDSKGAPVPFAMLTAAGSYWLTHWTNASMTDAEGRFELLAPRAGAAAELRFEPPRGKPQPLGQVTFGNDLQLAVTTGD